MLVYQLVQPKCTELKLVIQRLESSLSERRRILHKFLDLLESIESVGKWCATASDHLNRDTEVMDEDPFSQVRDL